jgi:hypothetical protein
LSNSSASPTRVLKSLTILSLLVDSLSIPKHLP